VSTTYPRIASLKTADAFARRLQDLGIPLPFDPTIVSGPDAPLGQPFARDGVTVGNRWCILPMEGWDGTLDGRPSDLTRRRWEHFGKSGAKLIWGGEAFAVRADGRANPNQLAMGPHAVEDLSDLRQRLVTAHREACGSTDDLFVGLQLTHSGRYARPRPGGSWEPYVAYQHPVLDRRFAAGTTVKTFTDEDLHALAQDFVVAARAAAEAGFDFVDVKHCHGYLGHELLSAVDREGEFGGDLEGRTRFLHLVSTAIRREAPSLRIGVRVSIFDAVPYRKPAAAAADAGTGVPEADASRYRHGFGLMTNGSFLPSLDDGRQFLSVLERLGITWVCLTAGSPYYNPHIQRPALFPPSDGYLPPEDPLVGVARQIAVVQALKRDFPSLALVGSGYSYLQDWLPNVAQAVVREGGADFVGLGRMVLSYPDLPLDVLHGRALRRAAICRTFSDCTSGPRNGLVSGCFPLDPFYKAHPDAERLKALKAEQETR